MQSEDLLIAGRAIKIVTGTGSQMINVFSEDEVPGVFEHSYKIRDRGKFITAATIEQMAFESIDKFIEYLRSERGAEARTRR